MGYHLRRWRRVSTEAISHVEFYARKQHVIPGRFEATECKNLLWLKASSRGVVRLTSFETHPAPRRRGPMLTVRTLRDISTPTGAIRMFDHRYAQPAPRMTES
jgi:hypothetical protein